MNIPTTHLEALLQLRELLFDLTYHLEALIKRQHLAQHRSCCEVCYARLQLSRALVRREEQRIWSLCSYSTENGLMSDSLAQEMEMVIFRWDGGK